MKLVSHILIRYYQCQQSLCSYSNLTVGFAWVICNYIFHIPHRLATFLLPWWNMVLKVCPLQYFEPSAWEGAQSPVLFFTHIYLLENMFMCNSFWTTKMLWGKCKRLEKKILVTYSKNVENCISCKCVCSLDRVLGFSFFAISSLSQCESCLMETQTCGNVILHSSLHPIHNPRRNASIVNICFIEKTFQWLLRLFTQTSLYTTK